jgi:hypothetical protein
MKTRILATYVVLLDVESVLNVLYKCRISDISLDWEDFQHKLQLDSNIILRVSKKKDQMEKDIKKCSDVFPQAFHPTQSLILRTKAQK